VAFALAMSQSSIRPGGDSDRLLARCARLGPGRSQSSIRPGGDSDAIGLVQWAGGLAKESQSSIRPGGDSDRNCVFEQPSETRRNPVFALEVIQTR